MRNIKLEDKLQKKRGYYFGGLESELSIKYNISRLYINEIRRHALHKRRTQQDICLLITERLSSSYYDTLPRKAYHLSKIRVKKMHEEVLKFLLHLPPDSFNEITRITKYDWDYDGEDRKLPLQETNK